jgi:hypothetical protein
MDSSPLDRIDHQGEVALSFSCGKDSIASWLYLRDRGIKVHPYFLDMCPGLPMTTKALEYYEDFFETKITVIAHPKLFPWIVDGLHQPHYRMAAIAKVGLPRYSTEDVMQAVSDEIGNPNIWHAVGVRANDSMNRRAAYAKTKGVVESRKVFWPIAEMKIAELQDILTKNNCKLPRDYDLFGRSFDGLHIGYVKPIFEQSPKDLEVLKFWYPMIETEIKRYEMKHEEKPLEKRMKAKNEDFDFEMPDFDIVESDTILDKLPIPKTLHEASAQEVGTLKSELAKADKNQRDRMKIMGDGDYNLQVVFQSSVQKQAFLAAMNLQADQGQYVSGVELSRLAGVDVKAINMPRTMKRTIKIQNHSICEDVQ